MSQRFKYSGDPVEKETLEGFIETIPVGFRNLKPQGGLPSRLRRRQLRSSSMWPQMMPMMQPMPGQVPQQMPQGMFPQMFPPPFTGAATPTPAPAPAPAPAAPVAAATPEQPQAQQAWGGQKAWGGGKKWSGGGGGGGQDWSQGAQGSSQAKGENPWWNERKNQKEYKVVWCTGCSSKSYVGENLCLNAVCGY
jgi:hypothetical protein